MKKQILLPTSVFRELYQTFKVHRVILSRALKYERNSKRDQMLRAAALQRGGFIWTGIPAPTRYMPDVDTQLDRANGYLRQSFGGRVELSLNLPTNLATISVDGNTVAEFTDMTISTWGNVLYSMQQMYNQLNA